jgi:hypothetical protein
MLTPLEKAILATARELRDDIDNRTLHHLLTALVREAQRRRKAN